MSADNRGICPKCHPGGDLDEFENTLREDYEQNMDSHGEYYCSYRCHCNVCGFKWSFKLIEQVTPRKNT